MKVAFIKIARIFHIERYFVIYPHKCTLKKLKKYQEKWENTYLIVKNARASRALRQALDPGQYFMAHFVCQISLHYVGKISEKISGPPLDQILDPLLMIPIYEHAYIFLFLVLKFGAFVLLLELDKCFSCCGAYYLWLFIFYTWSAS